MITLKIREFSCIENAEMQIGELTVVVGPQASGKSVISKLIYFFNDVIDFIDIFQEHNPSEPAHVLKDIAVKFKKWFPVEAWGKKRFEIEYSMGEVALTIKRTAFSAKPSQNIKVVASPILHAIYEKYTAMLSEDKSLSPKENADFRQRFSDSRWQLANSCSEEIVKATQGQFVPSQMFVPAGRSFFTSFGKAMTAFEHGGLLDQPTIRFGRVFAQFRETRFAYFDNEKKDKEFETLRELMTESLVGGTIHTGKEVDYVQSRDGRRVPFGFLSSGQQEVLPLLLTIDAISNRRLRSPYLYIEEPEAHLFPSSQGVLTEYLMQLLNKKLVSRLLLTTHSPYLLAKLNNLIKAAAVGKLKRKEVTQVISADKWTDASRISIYAIREKNVESVMDSDNLIDGEYLDEASSMAAQEFNALLEIEYAGR
jgi:predicted ATPase